MRIWGYSVFILSGYSTFFQTIPSATKVSSSNPSLINPKGVDILHKELPVMPAGMNAGMRMLPASMDLKGDIISEISHREAVEALRAVVAKYAKPKKKTSADASEYQYGDTVYPKIKLKEALLSEISHKTAQAAYVARSDRADAHWVLGDREKVKKDYAKAERTYNYAANLDKHKTKYAEVAAARAKNTKKSPVSEELKEMLISEISKDKIYGAYKERYTLAVAHDTVGNKKEAVKNATKALKHADSHADHEANRAKYEKVAAARAVIAKRAKAEPKKAPSKYLESGWQNEYGDSPKKEAPKKEEPKVVVKKTKPKTKKQAE